MATAKDAAIAARKLAVQVGGAAVIVMVAMEDEKWYCSTNGAKPLVTKLFKTCARKLRENKVID